MELAMINVNDVFISKDSKIKLRVLSYTGEGFDQSCYCLSETNKYYWNSYYSALYIEKYYTKLESL